MAKVTRSKSSSTDNRRLNISPVNPGEKGVSSERLERIKVAMQRYVDKKLVPGVVWLVARDGRVVATEAIGWRDVENRKPMQTDTIFRIASMTKPITSVALMMLFEEGHFLLSDPVSKWIPEFGDVKLAVPVSQEEFLGEKYKLVPPARPVTIRHLLTHTAGFGYQSPVIDRPNQVDEKQSVNETIGDFVKRYVKTPLMHQPGEMWDYSRATCVVGYLVELMSGMTLDEFFKERIFKPLDMPDTHFYLPLKKLDRFAACYTPGTDFKIKLSDAPTAESRFVKKPHVYFMGSGGLVSTLSDYNKFYQMMLNGGKLNSTRLLSRKTVELMTKNHVGDLPVWLPGPWCGFGLGFGVMRDYDHINTLLSGHPGPAPMSVGTFTWGGAFCTYPFADPREKLVAMMMTQVGPYNHLNIRQEFVGLVYQAIAD